MKIFILVFFSIIFCTSIKAQLVDLELMKYTNVMCDSLKLFGEIGSNRSFIEVNKLIYSRQIKLNISTVKYYEIGLTVSHGYKYIGVLSSESFKLLRSRDFSKEYSEIINPLLVDKKTKILLTDIGVFFKEIKEIYDYNLNPPWKK